MVVQLRALQLQEGSCHFWTLFDCIVVCGLTVDEITAFIHETVCS